MSAASPNDGSQQPPSASSKATVPPPATRETIPPPGTPLSAPGQRETILPGHSDSVAEVVDASGAAPSPQFGRYQLQECLGQGAMGAVYKAHDSQLDRLVAIKIPKFDASDSGLLERFYREARSAATLSHPNICPVFDVGEIDGTHYISMGYIEGKPLSAFIRPDKPLSEKQAVMIVRKLAVALDEAHNKGIIHRDLKPDNVMIGPKSNPIIMDFGLARRSTGTDDIRVTQGGQMLGTPAYMSPEQVEGDVNVMGPCSDIYSLGVILYELLTGRLPYEGSIASVLAQIIRAEPKPLVQLREALNPELQSICLKMMSSKPDDRYASMGDVARDLTAFVKGTPTTVHDSTAAVVTPGSTAAVATPGLPAGDAGLSQLIVADEVPVSVRTSRKSRDRTPTARSTTPSRRGLPSWAIWSGAAAFGITILLAGYTLFIKVGDKTVRIQIDDPNAQVFVDGDEVRIENLGASIELKPGEHGVEIRRGDIVVQADQFTVLKGDNPVLKLVVLDPEKVQDTPAATTPAPRPNSPDTPAPSIPAALAESDDPVRRAVGWALSRGFRVLIEGAGFISNQQYAKVPAGKLNVQQIGILTGQSIRREEWQHLKSLTALSFVEIRHADFDDDALSQLKNAPQLNRLDLADSSVTSDGLQVLTTLPVLRTVRIARPDPRFGEPRKTPAPEIDDSAVSHICQIKNLVDLDLTRCAITDRGLAMVADVPGLQNLRIEAGQITDAGVAHLIGIRKLTALALNDVPVTDAAVDSIAQLTSLKTLSLDHTAIGDGSVEKLSTLKNLQTLALAHTQVSDAGLAHLKDMPELRYLTLSDTNIGDAGLANLPALQLRNLTINNAAVTAAGIAEFKQAHPDCRVISNPRSSSKPAGSAIPARFADSADPAMRAVGWALSRNHTIWYRTASGSGQTSVFKPLENQDFKVQRLLLKKTGNVQEDDWSQLANFGPDLDHVTINHLNFGDTELEHLAKLPGLKILALEASAITASGFERLAEFPVLEQVQFGSLSSNVPVSVSDATLSVLMNIPGLQTLILDNCRLTDDSLQTLAASDSLRALTMRNCNLTDASLEHLRDLTLKTLHLQGNALTDAAGLALSQIKSLESLTLRKTKVGDETCKLLSTLPRLQSLDMSETEVTSSGLEDVTKLTSLKTLVLDKTRVDDAALKQLVDVSALRTLWLKETHCTTDAIDEFRKTRSQCFVGFSKAADASVTATDLSWLKLSDEMPEVYRNSADLQVRVLGWMIDRGVNATILIDQSDEVTAEQFKDGPPVMPFVINTLRVVDRQSIKGDEWTFLQSLPNIVRATFTGADIDDGAISHLTDHSRLEVLTLAFTSVSDKGTAILATMAQLKQVQITCNPDMVGRQAITDVTMKHLASISELGNLSLEYCDVTDLGVAQLAAARPPLTSLRLRYSKGITAEGIAHIRYLPGLTSLNLDGMIVDDEIASIFAALPQLSILSMTGTKTGDRTLQALSQLHRLTAVNMAGTQVTDAGLKHLRGRSLDFLALSQSDVTDAGVAQLGAVDSLQHLDLSRTNVTNSSLAILAGIKGIRVLQLNDTRVTRSAAQALQDSHPNLQVSFPGVKKRK